jgi:protein SCO1/2
MKNNVIFLCVSLLLIACNSEGENSGDNSNESVEQTGSGLPFIGFHDYGKVMKDGKEVMDTVYHAVPQFALTAQDSSLFTNEIVDGKVHVVNFFFTSCPSICPAMTAQMKRLQGNTNDIDELLFLSHTIDPRRDTIPKLNAYIKKKELDTHNWYFLYGEKEYVHDLAVTGYMINAMEDEAAEGGFMHSEHFILVDREGHIRGLYEGTDTDRVDQLEKDIRKLIENEYGQ